MCITPNFDFSLCAMYDFRLFRGEITGNELEGAGSGNADINRTKIIFLILKFPAKCMKPLTPAYSRKMTSNQPQITTQ
jgi:hypothetical protein